MTSYVRLGISLILLFIFYTLGKRLIEINESVTPKVTNFHHSSATNQRTFNLTNTTIDDLVKRQNILTTQYEPFHQTRFPISSDGSERFSG